MKFAFSAQVSAGAGPRIQKNVTAKDLETALSGLKAQGFTVFGINQIAEIHYEF